MIIERDWILVDVVPHAEYEITLSKSKAGGNPDGLLRIFHQYALETFGENITPPLGRYQVSRTKWPLRQAVYKVHILK